MPKKPKNSSVEKKAENPNAFKLWINRGVLVKIAESIRQDFPSFDSSIFVGIARELDALELKPRVHRVRDQLRAQLPEDYLKALKILLKAVKRGNLDGFDLWPFTEFVQTYGLDHPELSLEALYVLTEKFTGEFAVRPFLKKHPKLTQDFLMKCATDANVHVRRWVSEGTRPRLPWGERLNAFIEQPKTTLPLLEKLKHDSELYVRKSIANHLNDIAKDHPEVVLGVLKKWKSGAPEIHADKIEWIIHRSLRSLIKAGHPGALTLIGASPNNTS